VFQDVLDLVGAVAGDPSDLLRRHPASKLKVTQVCRSVRMVSLSVGRERLTFDQSDVVLGWEEGMLFGS